mmetsp:Transcript_33502/g.94821  ORF Transcript_33502/g.94821 Transcript_33502/m.94821 type:complete len:234 (+) Transcript_33502:624-1325(+)
MAARAAWMASDSRPSTSTAAAARRPSWERAFAVASWPAPLSAFFPLLRLWAFRLGNHDSRQMVSQLRSSSRMEAARTMPSPRTARQVGASSAQTRCAAPCITRDSTSQRPARSSLAVGLPPGARRVAKLSAAIHRARLQHSCSADNEAAATSSNLAGSSTPRMPLTSATASDSALATLLGDWGSPAQIAPNSSHGRRLLWQRALTWESRKAMASGASDSAQLSLDHQQEANPL